ncbi:MAG TPA: Os1348 family NHLP clan protein [Candidatus Methylomirabilis sp.]|nr:Os1348 family NHLP clan protein [Candidatus Methylomirabilis sp.]
MSQSAVERALGKLMTDRLFREQFFEDPAGASAFAGLDLSEAELKALSRLPSSAVSRFSLFLDDRITRLRLDEQPV